MSEPYDYFGNGNEEPTVLNSEPTPDWNRFTPDDSHRVKKTYSRYFLALAIYLLVASFAAYLVSFLIARSPLSENEFLNSATFALIENAIVMYILAMAAFYPIIHGMRKVEIEKSRLSFKEILIFYCIAQAFITAGSLAGNFLNNIISTILSAITGIDMSIHNEVGELISGANLPIAILLVGIVGPIVEELLFRKFLIDRVSMYGDKIAIVVSAVAFGLFHGNLYQVFYAAVLGLLLGYIYTRTRNILYPILLHMAINTFSTLAALLIPFEEDLYMLAEQAASGESVNTLAMLGDLAIVGAYLLVHYGTVIAGIVLFLTRKNRIFISDRCEITIPKGRRFQTVFVNFGVIFYTVVTVIEILIALFSPLLQALIHPGS